MTPADELRTAAARWEQHARDFAWVSVQGRDAEIDRLRNEVERLTVSLAMAQGEAKRLREDHWIVPKIGHDPDAAVGPYIKGRLIRRDEGVSHADHTRTYAAQLLAAADAVKHATAPGEAT